MIDPGMDRGWVNEGMFLVESGVGVYKKLRKAE